MRSSAIGKAILGLTAVVCSTAPVLAYCPMMPATHMPEIDGAAGVSALAVLISAGMMLYNRVRC